VKLKNGQVKHRAEHQKKKAKANAVVADSSGDSKQAIEGEEGKGNGKNYEKNQKRKTRMKAALAMLKETEKSDGSPTSTATSTDESTGSSKSKPAKGFDPGSLTANQLATVSKFLAGFHQASAEPSSADPSTEPPSPAPAPAPSNASHGSIVKRLMGVFEHNGTEYPTAVANSVSAGTYKPK
jgi:hypothetical protein